MATDRGKCPVDDAPPDVEGTTQFLQSVGVNAPMEGVQMSFANLIGGFLNVVHIERGKISCLLTVKSPILNVYNGMHGGAVAGVATRVARGCVRTVIGREMDVFLGELSVSYLSSAALQAEVIIEGSVVRRGRNITVVTVDFRPKESKKLLYTSCATFYHMPNSRL